VAIDQDSRLIITWLVGTRDDWAARDFITNLGSRLANRVQITTDGYKPYMEAIEAEFGINVDYARLIKQCGKDGGDAKEVHQAANTPLTP